MILHKHGKNLEAIELNKNKNHAWNNMGIILRELGRNEEALNVRKKQWNWIKILVMHGIIRVFSNMNMAETWKH